MTESFHRNRFGTRKSTERAPEVETKRPSTAEPDHKVRFSFFDILRMLSGFILLNVFISYFTTGTLTYNATSLPITHPLHSPTRYIHFNYIHTPVTMTPTELSLHNGTDDALPLYVAVNGTVFDVSGSKRVYGPGGSYGFFGGKECSFALATTCLNYLGGVNEVELKAEELRRLKGWVEFFERKYFKVGSIQNEETDGSNKKGSVLKVDERDVCIGKGNH